MIDFPLYILYITSILVSAVMALATARSLRKKGLYILAWYLPLVFIQELTLYLLDEVWPIFFSNALVYNIYRVVTLIVFAVIYYRTPFMATWRKWIGWLTLSYLLIVVLNYTLIESPFATSSYISLIRGFVITIYAVLFLYSYFNLDDKSQELYWRPLLWITIGVVTFYPVVSISLAFQKFLAANEATLYGLKLYQVIPRLMSIFMYGCFSYAFYLCQKKN